MGNYYTWWWGSGSCVLTSLTGNFDAWQSLRTTALYHWVIILMCQLGLYSIRKSFSMESIHGIKKAKVEGELWEGSRAIRRDKKQGAHFANSIESKPRRNPLRCRGEESCPCSCPCSAAMLRCRRNASEWGQLTRLSSVALQICCRSLFQHLWNKRNQTHGF